MTKIRFAKVVVALFLISTALLVGVGFHVQSQAYRHRKSAEILLAELQKLKVGESTINDVQQLVRSQSQFVSQDTPLCWEGFCTYTFVYGNYNSTVDIYALRWLGLWRFHLIAAPVAFVADLSFRRDRLVRASMLLNSQVSLNLQDEVSDISPVPASYVVDNSRPSQTVIYIKPDATAAQRETAYSFNLRCIDKLGGCSDKAQLFQRVR